jgi:predicted esterase
MTPRFVRGCAWAAALAACSGRDAPSHVPGTGASAGSGMSAGSGVVGTTSATSATSTSGSGGSDEGPLPSEADLPVPYGECPNFVSGKNTLTIAGLPARGVEVRFSTASEAKNGPLVVVWHGDDQSPKAALEELVGSKYVAKFLADGGVVAVPDHDPAAKGATWFASQGDFTVDDDFVVFDQLVACVRQQFGIDTRHIHTIGYQHGGFQAAHVALLRSTFVASAVVHSGGVAAAAKEQKGGLHYPFMVLHGGETLDVAAEPYGQASVALAKLAAQGATPFSSEHFTVLCDHGTGPAIATDALPATYAFLMAHPFGLLGSPYEVGLPADFPTFCATAN